MTNFIGTLPDELIINILSFLNMKDILTLSRVNKHFKMLTNDEYLWKQIYCGHECRYRLSNSYKESVKRMLKETHIILDIEYDKNVTDLESHDNELFDKIIEDLDIHGYHIRFSLIYSDGLDYLMGRYHIGACHYRMYRLRTNKINRIRLDLLPSKYVGCMGVTGAIGILVDKCSFCGNSYCLLEYDDNLCHPKCIPFLK